MLGLGSLPSGAAKRVAHDAECCPAAPEGNIGLTVAAMVLDTSGFDVEVLCLRGHP
jgi:hypothetical protein